MDSIFVGSIIPLVATIDPQTVANVEKFSDVVDMSKFDQVIATALLGDMAAETIDFKAYSCDSNGSNAAALKSATQLAAHAANNDNSQIIICVKASELLASGKRHVKFGMVTGNTAGGTAAVAVHAISPGYGLAQDQDLESVKEVKQ